MDTYALLAIWAPSGWELLIVLVIALLLFGKRLPEVARGLGKGIVEFKKGMRGIEDEIDNTSYEPPRSSGPAYAPPPNPERREGTEAPANSPPQG